ncbi:MAG: BLUF domain-containing protein [Bacteroidales bacterium]|nr:BLUF domain-containing protein [Bacteroidales bacterium]
MLYQIIYVSKRNCSEEEITKILDKSRENNQKINVTGLLLYTKDTFIQCIEGEKDEVNTLYDKIRKDERHSNPILISYKPIKNRDFPSWNMGEKKINLEETDFMADMSGEEKIIFSNILSGKEETNAIDVIRKLV